MTPCHVPPFLDTSISTSLQLFGLEMCVDETDESEDENNEVLVVADDDSDTD